jgi:nucleotide-binding universal stress UspA family protein
MAAIKIERILCPVDFSEFSVGAYGYASSLAQRYRATLLVQHVVELWRHPSACFSATADLYVQYCRGLLTGGEVELQHFVKRHAQNGIHPECVIRKGMATDCLLSFADEQAVSLIVMGTHRRRGFDRLMLGSVTEKVLREGHCPVLAVRKPSRNFVASATLRDAIELRQILFCTDFSDYSNRRIQQVWSV